MWKAGVDVKASQDTGSDDWETDADFVVSCNFVAKINNVVKCNSQVYLSN